MARALEGLGRLETMEEEKLGPESAAGKPPQQPPQSAAEKPPQKPPAKRRTGRA